MRRSLANLFGFFFPHGWRAAILAPLLTRFVRRGTLIVRHPDGPELNFGDCGAPSVAVRFHDRSAITQLVFNPELALGELYMDGRLSIEDGRGIADLLDLVFSNRGRKSLPLRLRVV